MSFTLKIGITENSSKRVDKEVSWKYNLSGTLKDECSIKNPIIVLRIGNSVNIKVPDITNCNYAYIENFNRYYFIRDFRSIRNTQFEIDLQEDVLMSFKDEIYKQNAIIRRTASDTINVQDIEDSDVYHYAESIIVTKKLTTADGFTKEDSKGSYVMVTAGPSAAV